MPGDKTEEKKEEQKAEEKSEDKEEESSEEEREEEKETEDEEVTEGEESEDEKEVEEAVNFYKALKGPDGKEIVRRLAVQAKLLAEEEGLSKRDAKKAITEVLKEELGDEYEYLAGRFGKALERIIQSEVGEVKRQLNESNKAQKEKESDSALARFHNEYKDAKNFERKMLQKMQLHPLGTGDIFEYLEDIYVLSGGKRNGTGKSSLNKAMERMKENAKDANLASSDVDEKRVKRGPQRPSIQESVEAAAKGITFQD